MIGTLALDRAAIADVCLRHRVARLRVFGSAVTGHFDPRTSDVDLLVEFRPDAPRGISPLLDLQEELERVIGRPIDLIESAAIRNPYFASRAFDEAVEIYAA